MKIIKIWVLVAAVVFLLSACKQSAPEYFEADIPHGLLGENVVPQSYRVDMVINPDDAGYSGVVEIDVEIKKPTRQIWLHSKNMSVEGALGEAGELAYPLSFTELPASEAPSGIAKLTSENLIPSGLLTVRLPFETPFNLNLNSAYKVVDDQDAYVVTQFEPLGAREAFPSFDEPRFKVPFTLSITAPAEDFVYSNTPEVSAAEQENGWVKHQFAETLPLPTYLIAFGVGPFDVVAYADLPATEVRDRPINLRGIAARGQGGKLEYALENTAGILEAIEAYFAIPYPYEKLDLIAAPEYAFGAMENPGAIVYREYLLLLDDNAPLSQKRAYASVHSHELAHQWFGNLVTHFDRNNQKSALGAMNLDSLASTRKIREPLLRSENVLDQFDSITYRKGGGVLSMIESYLGEDNFRKGVQLHMKRFEHGVATADDFFQSLAEGSGRPEVVEALKSFVDQPGVPLVKVGYGCENRTRNTPIGEEPLGLTTIELEQYRNRPLGSTITQGQNWQIPVCIVAISPYGKNQKKCTLLTDSNLTNESPKALKIASKLTCPAAIMPNADGAGYYRFTMPSENWAALLENIDKLNTKEVLAVQDSLLAAYRAGEVGSSVYLDGVEKFAKHAEYDVISKAGDLLGFMDNHLPEAARPDYEPFVRDIYQDKYVLTPTLLGNLIERAGDKSLLAEYSQKGAAYLGLDGDVDKSAVPLNLLSFALGAVMIEREDDAYEPLLRLMEEGTILESSNAISALVDVRSPDRARALLTMALDADGPVSQNQAAGIVAALIGKQAHSDMAWQWFEENFDEYAVNRVPDARRSGMPLFARGFCSVEQRDALNVLIKNKAALIPGYERNLAQTLERIELCAALKTAKINELAMALAER